MSSFVLWQEVNKLIPSVFISCPYSYNVEFVQPKADQRFFNAYFKNQKIMNFFHIFPNSKNDAFGYQNILRWLLHVCKIFVLESTLDELEKVYFKHYLRKMTQC